MLSYAYRLREHWIEQLGTPAYRGIAQKSDGGQTTEAVVMVRNLTEHNLTKIVAPRPPRFIRVLGRSPDGGRFPVRILRGSPSRTQFRHTDEHRYTIMTYGGQAVRQIAEPARSSAARDGTRS
jgi:hypothetical protein